MAAPPPPFAPSGESDGGAFGWWMPGSNTGAKVGVFIAIVGVVVMAAVATHWVVKRWKQHHGAEQGSLDDQEILGPNAIKELFFSRPANANTDAEDPSHAFSDGSVWLKEEARRRYQSTGLLQPTPAGTSAQDAPVPAPPTQRLGFSAQGAQLELTQPAVPSGASPGPLQAEDSMSIASSTAYLLDERRLGRDMAGQDGPEISPALTPMHFPTIYNGTSSGPLYTTPSSKGPPPPGSEGCSPQEVLGSGPGAGGLLLGTHSYASSAAGEPSGVIQRPEHLAMMGTMAIMCPGEPALEQRLARVLQEALHGPGSNGGASPPLPAPSSLLAPYPSMAPYPSVALLPTMAEGTEGVPSPAAGARTASTSAFTHASTNEAVAASLREGNRHVIDMQPSIGAGVAGFGGVGLFAWPGGSGPQMWAAGGVPAGMRPGTGTVTARDILTGARSPRDLAALMAAAQQQPAVMRGGSPRSHATAAAYGQNIGPASSQCVDPASSQPIGPASSPAPVMPLGASPSQPQGLRASSPAPSPFETPAPQQLPPPSTSPRCVPLACLSLVPYSETEPGGDEQPSAVAGPVTGPDAPQQQQRHEPDSSLGEAGQPIGNETAQASSQPTTPVNTEPSTPVKGDTGLCSMPLEKPLRASMASAAAPAGADEIDGKTGVARADSGISIAAVDQLTVISKQQVTEEEHGEMQQPPTPVRSSTPAAIGGQTVSHDSLEAACEAEPPTGSQPATPSAVPSSTSAMRARLDQSPFEAPSGTPLNQSPFSNSQSIDKPVASRPPRPPSETGWRASLPEVVPVAGPSQGLIRQRSQTTSSAGQSMSSVSSRDYTQYDRHRLSGPGDASGRPVHMSMNEFAAERISGRLTGMSSLTTPGMSRAGSMAEQPAVSVDRELLSNPLFGARLTPGAPSNSSRLSVAGAHIANVRGASAVAAAASDDDDDDELL